MTAREVFEGMLIELSKVNAPSLTLSEFNYYFNKAINQYINKRYSIYDMNLLTTDDIRVLKSTAILNAADGSLKRAYEDYDRKDALSYLTRANNIISNLQGATYEVNLPDDYLHLLNCVCVYRVNKDYKCYDGGSFVQVPAKRLTADSWATIVTDFYNRPTPERPYFYIHNVNTSYEVPTAPATFDENGIYLSGTDMGGIYGVTSNGMESYNDVEGGQSLGEGNYDLSGNKGSNFERVRTMAGSNNISTVQRATAHRYGNASKVRMEIRYGKDNSIFELVEVAIDYIKSPQHIRLTQELLDMTEDFSQIMEFPDYVCQEIINELSTLVMERTADPRTASHQSVTTSILDLVAQALAQQAQAAAGGGGQA